MSIRDRLFYIKNEVILREGETLILVRGDEMIAQWSSEKEECLNEVSGEVKEELQNFLNWLHDDNQY